MKIVVIGGTGLIGSKVVAKLRGHGHEAVAASPNSGVNTLTGEGLAEVLEGAAVVVDVSNSPSFEDAGRARVLRDLDPQHPRRRSAPPASGISSRCRSSGAERLPDSGYLRAKVAQEKLIEASSDPVLDRARDAVLRVRRGHRRRATDGDTVRLPSVLFQPIAADDVAAAVGRGRLGCAAGRHVIEIGGPEQFRFDELVRRGLERRTIRARWSPTRTPATSAPS